MILGLVLVLLPKQGFSFWGDSKSIRDSFFVRYPEKPWNFRLYQVNKFSNTTFISGMDSIPPIRYKPNSNPGLGIGIFYRGIGAFLGLSLPSTKRDIRIRGKTRRLDLQLNQYGKRFGVDANFQYFKGYYIANSREIRLPVISNHYGYELRPDLRSFTLGLSTYYVFNWKKFSIRSAFVQTEIQRKSAGSFILGTSMSIYAFNADSAILPLNYRVPGNDESYKRGTFLSTSLSPGYSYTLIIKESWYFNMTMLAGAGLLYRKIGLDNGTTSKDYRIAIRLQPRAAFGYNSDHYFFGLSAVSDAYNLPLNAARMQYSFGNLRVFFGIRPKL